MKKLIRLGLGIAIFCLCSGFFSCKNYIDTLSLAGYSYKLDEIRINEVVTENLDDSSKVESILKFGKDGSTVELIFSYGLGSVIGDTDEYVGTYSVDSSAKKIILTLKNEKSPWVLTYKDANYFKMEKDFIRFEDSGAYPVVDGVKYQLIYKFF